MLRRVRRSRIQCFGKCQEHPVVPRFKRHRQQRWPAALSATATQGSCTGTTNVSCILGTLADGNSAQIALVVTKTVGGNVSNTASVTATEADPFMLNNSNSETSTPAELTNFRVE